MKPEVDNKQFMLTGVEEDGSLRLFRLLVKTPELATQTRDALLKELEE